MADKTTIRKSAGTFEERFLKELARNCDGQDIAVPNRVLREQLGWQDERFDKVRSGLIGKGVIKAATGRGGQTKFVNFVSQASNKKSLKIFVSYSHHDESMKDSLLKHLKPLERLGLISSWHDRMIKPGDSFGEVINSELNNADIILFLVSVDFINSKYCYEVELGRAIERHKEGSARVIPIILRDCLWSHSPFGGLQALPKDAKAVASWSDKDETFTAVAKAVHQLAVDLIEA